MNIIYSNQYTSTLYTKIYTHTHLKKILVSLDSEGKLYAMASSLFYSYCACPTQPGDPDAPTCLVPLHRPCCRKILYRFESHYFLELLAGKKYPVLRDDYLSSWFKHKQIWHKNVFPDQIHSSNVIYIGLWCLFLFSLLMKYYMKINYVKTSINLDLCGIKIFLLDSLLE